MNWAVLKLTLADGGKLLIKWHFCAVHFESLWKDNLKFSASEMSGERWASTEFYRLQGKKKNIPFRDMLARIGFYHTANTEQVLGA